MQVWPNGVRRIQVLSVELLYEGDEHRQEELSRFYFSSNPDDILKVMMDTFEHVIVATSAIPELEPIIMERLFWGTNCVLTNVHPQEHQVTPTVPAVPAALPHARHVGRCKVIVYEFGFYQAILGLC